MHRCKFILIFAPIFKTSIKMKDNKPMYERTKEIRMKLGITANVLAQAVGLAPSTITRYERGEIPLSTDKAYAILDALNCDIEVIENPIPRPTEQRLWTIAKSQIAEDIIELQFLALWGRQKTMGGKVRLVNKFAAGQYEPNSGRATASDIDAIQKEESIINQEWDRTEVVSVPKEKKKKRKKGV